MSDPIPALTMGPISATILGFYCGVVFLAIISASALALLWGVKNPYTRGMVRQLITGMLLGAVVSLTFIVLALVGEGQVRLDHILPWGR